MPIIKINISLFVIGVMFIGALSYSVGASDLAQPKISALPESDTLPALKQFEKTHPEKIVFTHIKLGGGELDIENFARISPLVEKAQEIDKSAVLFSEYGRISNNFNMHDQKQAIIVHTKVRGDEYSSLQDLIVFNEFHDKTFFRFKMYGYNVGLVPEKVEKFSRLQLSKSRAESLFQAIQGSGDAIAEFMLIPTYSDVKKPLVIDDEDIWLMFARVAEFRLWNDSDDNKKLLWYYRAPWYSPDDNDNIGDLYIKE